MINIPISRPYFDSDELQEIGEVLKSRWVTQGPEVEKFEQEASQYLGVKYAIAVTNCTSALHLALLSLEIGKGDSVLVSDFTFPATAFAVMHCGAKPVFVDINPQTYNMDPSLIDSKILRNTKAIIPVHTFGQSSRMNVILKIAKDYNIKVVEDAACAFGTKFRDKFVGTLGDIGCFSFHARKGITSGEGGLVVTNDEEIADKVRCLANFGVTSAWARYSSPSIPKFTSLGYNCKMSDITAAVAVAQLRKIDKIIRRKQRLAKYYDRAIERIDYIKAPFRAKDSTHIYQSYVTLIDEDLDRDKIISNLMRLGLQTNCGTYACHAQPVFSSIDKCPFSLEISNRTLALPLYCDMTFRDIDTVISALRKVLQRIE